MSEPQSVELEPVAAEALKWVTFERGDSPSSVRASLNVGGAPFTAVLLDEAGGWVLLLERDGGALASLRIPRRDVDAARKMGAPWPRDERACAAALGIALTFAAIPPSSGTWTGEPGREEFARLEKQRAAAARALWNPVSGTALPERYRARASITLAAAASTAPPAACPAPSAARAPVAALSPDSLVQTANLLAERIASAGRLDPEALSEAAELVADKVASAILERTSAPVDVRVAPRDAHVRIERDREGRMVGAAITETPPSSASENAIAAAARGAR